MEIATKDSPVQLVKPAVVTQLLGRVRTIAPVVGVPKVNNTRWLVDIDTDGSDIRLELLDGRIDRVVQTDLLTFSLAALNEAFYEGRPWVEIAPDNSFLTLRAKAPCRYRLTIDVMASLHR